LVLLAVVSSPVAFVTVAVVLAVFPEVVLALTESVAVFDVFAPFPEVVVASLASSAPPWPSAAPGAGAATSLVAVPVVAPSLPDVVVAPFASVVTVSLV
jgi:hypothetical protein